MKNNRMLYETILVTAIIIAGMLFIPSAKTLFALLPVAYLLIERRLQKRTWGEPGFNIRTFWADLRANWILFVLLAFGIQPLSALWARAYFPAFVAHVQACLPFETGIPWGVLLPLLAISVVDEAMAVMV